MAVLDLDSILSKQGDYFQYQEDVDLAYLFGSYARRQAGTLSDLDVAVLMAGHPDKEACLKTRLRFMGDLSNLLSFEEIDVVILNCAPPALRYHILRDGIIMFNRDEDRRIEFTLNTVNRFLDFKPILERHERAIIERARKGELAGGKNAYHGALERYRKLRQRLAGIAETDL
jgi:uncharacterized protein